MSAPRPNSSEDAPPARARAKRRVVVPPPDGVDPHPTPEPERFGESDNDERLTADKPPHY